MVSSGATGCAGEVGERGRVCGGLGPAAAYVPRRGWRRGGTWTTAAVIEIRLYLASTPGRSTDNVGCHCPPLKQWRYGSFHRRCDDQLPGSPVARRVVGRNARQGEITQDLGEYVFVH